MLQPQKELCLEECQIEASDYRLVSDARSSSAARRRTILIFFREAKFSSPPSLRFDLIAQRALRSLQRRPVYRTVCRSPNLLFSMRLNSKSDGLLGLFDFDFCSSGFNLLLDLFRFFFCDSLFDRLGSAFDQGFRFGES